MTDQPVLFVAIVLSGLLSGNELATLIAFHPALRRIPLRSQVEAERALTSLLGAIMPVYMTATLAATTAAALALNGTPRFQLALIAAGAIAVMLAITVTQNLPLNRQTVKFPLDGDEQSWSRIRRRWERLHVLRVALDASAFACLVAALAVR